MENNTAPAIGHNNPPDADELLRAELTKRHPTILSGTERLLASAGRAPTVVKTPEEAEGITALIKLITNNGKALEGARVAEKEPFLNGGRVVDNFFKKHADSLEAAKSTVNRSLTVWLNAQAEIERKRRAEEEAAERARAAKELEAATALEQQGHTQFAESAIAQAAITEQNANKLATSAAAKPAHLASSRSVSGTASLRTRTVGEIIDREKLDLNALRQHLPADALQKALNSFIAAGGRTLPGARIFEQSDAVVR